MHKEYRRIVKNAEKAVLFIHGIVGTPNHFSEFVKLIPSEWSVYNILLDGHGKSAADFSKTSMKKWKQQVSQAVNELAAAHKEVFVAAHSLGCLLAIEEAIAGGKIAKMFLLAVPLKLLIRPKMIKNSLKVYFGAIDPQDKELLAARACYGIADSKNPLHYLGWIPRFLELFTQIRKTRKVLPRLTVPTAAYQSQKDEMVSGRSGELLAANPGITVIVLKNSGHYYYEDQDFLFLKSEFSNFLSDQS